jgi:hypothetical protein
MSLEYNKTTTQTPASLYWVATALDVVLPPLSAHWWCSHSAHNAAAMLLLPWLFQSALTHTTLTHTTVISPVTHVLPTCQTMNANQSHDAQITRSKHQGM